MTATIRVTQVANGLVCAQVETAQRLPVPFTVLASECRELRFTRDALLRAGAAALLAVEHEEQARRYTAELGALTFDAPEAPSAPLEIYRDGRLLRGRVAPGSSGCVIRVGGHERFVSANKRGEFSIDLGGINPASIDVRPVDRSGRQGSVRQFTRETLTRARG